MPKLNEETASSIAILLSKLEKTPLIFSHILDKLNELELQNVRHLVGEHETSYQKLSSYAQNCTDPQIKQMFEKSAQDALNTKQKLMGFLTPND